jgi:hypothetical protein
VWPGKGRITHTGPLYHRCSRTCASLRHRFRETVLPAPKGGITPSPKVPAPPAPPVWQSSHHLLPETDGSTSPAPPPSDGRGSSPPVAPVGWAENDNGATASAQGQGAFRYALRLAGHQAATNGRAHDGRGPSVVGETGAPRSLCLFAPLAPPPSSLSRRAGQRRRDACRVRHLSSRERPARRAFT